MLPRTTTLLTLALLACPACSYVEDDADLEFRTTSVGGGTGPGTVFNTNQIDDAYFSELVPKPGDMGMMVRAVALADYTEIDRLKMDAQELVALDPEDKLHRSEDLLDSTWSLGISYMLPTHTMMLSEYEVINGVPHYGFYHMTGDGWEYNCGPGGIPTKHPHFARLLPGFHLDETTGDLEPSSTAIFMACLSGAVGKAASWGYYGLPTDLIATDLEYGGPLLVGAEPEPVGELKPAGQLVPAGEVDEAPVADSGPEDTELDALERFELAIRVVRADYCYDGVSWTHPGVELHVEDIWGIRGQANPDADIEAVWGADGLLCISTSRTGAKLEAECLKDLPECQKDLSLADYELKGLFMTRLP